MYASIPDALRALARKIGADANGRNEEEILNNIVVKLGGTPIRNHGVAGSIDAMTKVVDLDVMHNMTTLNVTPTSEAQTIIPESPVDGYSQVNVAAAPSATLIEKTIAANGTYTASDDDADGYSSITVNVADENNANFVYYNNPTQAGVFSFKISIEKIKIPEGFTTITASDFNTAPSLKEITIPSTVTTIIEGAFTGSSNLTTITIHKAEGSISGAPWGAPNATVVWDG